MSSEVASLSPASSVTLSAPPSVAGSQQTQQQFTCDICSRTFGQRRSYLAHRKSHEEVKFKYFCEHCNMGFLILSKLVAHRRKHTGEKPFQCVAEAKCLKRFRYKGDLAKHIKRQHPTVQVTPDMLQPRSSSAIDIDGVAFTNGSPSQATESVVKPSPDAVPIRHVQTLTSSGPSAVAAHSVTNGDGAGGQHHQSLQTTFKPVIISVRQDPDSGLRRLVYGPPSSMATGTVQVGAPTANGGHQPGGAGASSVQASTHNGRNLVHPIVALQNHPQATGPSASGSAIQYVASATGNATPPTGQARTVVLLKRSNSSTVEAQPPQQHLVPSAAKAEPVHLSPVVSIGELKRHCSASMPVIFQQQQQQQTQNALPQRPLPPSVGPVQAAGGPTSVLLSGFQHLLPKHPIDQAELNRFSSPVPAASLYTPAAKQQPVPNIAVPTAHSKAAVASVNCDLDQADEQIIDMFVDEDALLQTDAGRFYDQPNSSDSGLGSVSSNSSSASLLRDALLASPNTTNLIGHQPSSVAVSSTVPTLHV